MIIYRCNVNKEKASSAREKGLSKLLLSRPAFPQNLELREEPIKYKLISSLSHQAKHNST